MKSERLPNRSKQKSKLPTMLKDTSAGIDGEKVMKFSHIITVSLCVFLLSSCNRVGTFNVVNPPDIIVHVNKNKAEITTPGSSKCKVQNQGKNGCVAFDHGETGLMTFKRTGPPSWSFTTLEICKLKTNGDKDCKLNIWERFEFAVTDSQGSKILIPDINGRVDLKPLSASLDEFILLDQNTVAQEYYYSVEVCPASGECAWADPPIENKGKN